MYKAIIVDDDIAVLSFLKTMIPWSEYNFELIGSYTNAHDALEHSKTLMPDLVITDIGMPIMDGMQFIHELKTLSDQPQFLILSCHDDFKYAQQAMQLRVHDYILKETLNIKSMEAILTRLHDRIKETDLLQQKVKKLRFQAQQSQTDFKEKWFRDYLTTPFNDSTSWKKQLIDYGVSTEMNQYVPVVCSIHRFHGAISRYKNEDLLKFILNNVIEESLEQVSNVVCFSHSAKQFNLIFAYRNDLKFDPFEKIERIGKELQYSISHALKLNLSVIIGSSSQDGNVIRHQFRELIQSKDILFYSRDPEIIRYNLIPPIDLQDDLLSYYSEYLEQLNRLILDGNSNASTFVDPFITFITSRRFQPVIVKQFIFKLVLDIQMRLTFKHEYSNEKIQQLLEHISNIDELKIWMLSFIEEAVEIMEGISKQSKKSEIVEAQKYILLHLDQKISLEEVADLLYLNSSYFSRLFKKETGENFTEYVTRVKMEKAKKLMLESNKNVSMIAEMLGYDNKGYFVKLFKNHFGVSPARYS